jgi:hypothetical protein
MVHWYMQDNSHGLTIIKVNPMVKYIYFNCFTLDPMVALWPVQPFLIDGHYKQTSLAACATWGRTHSGC